MKKMLKKALTSAVCVAVSIAVFAGCTPTKVGKTESSDGKVHISIGGLPTTRTDENAFSAGESERGETTVTVLSEVSFVI